MRFAWMTAAVAACVVAMPASAAIPTFTYKGTISGDAGSYVYIPVPGPYYGKPVSITAYFSAPSDGITAAVWAFESYNDTCFQNRQPYYCGGNDYDFVVGYGEAPSGSNSLSFTYYDPSASFRTKTEYGYRDTYLEYRGGNIEYRFASAGDVTYTIIATTGVPEPATWALMILGFGAVGGAMRRRPRIRLSTAY